MARSNQLFLLPKVMLLEATSYLTLSDIIAFMYVARSAANVLNWKAIFLHYFPHLINKLHELIPLQYTSVVLTEENESKEEIKSSSQQPKRLKHTPQLVQSSQTLNPMIHFLHALQSAERKEYSEDYRRKTLDYRAIPLFRRFKEKTPLDLKEIEEYWARKRKGREDELFTFLLSSCDSKGNSLFNLAVQYKHAGFLTKVMSQVENFLMPEYSRKPLDSRKMSLIHWGAVLAHDEVILEQKPIRSDLLAEDSFGNHALSYLIQNKRLELLISFRNDYFESLWNEANRLFNDGRNEAAFFAVNDVLLSMPPEEEKKLSVNQKIMLLDLRYRICQKQERYDEALQDINQILELEQQPQIPQRMLDKATILASLKHHVEEVKIYDAIIAISISHLLEALERKIKTISNHFPRSPENARLIITCCDEFITKECNFIHIHEARAGALISLARYEEALISKMEVCRLDGSYESFFEGGQVALQAENYKQAEVLFNRAIEIRPEDNNAKSCRTICLSRIGSTSCSSTDSLSALLSTGSSSFFSGSSSSGTSSASSDRPRLSLGGGSSR